MNPIYIYPWLIVMVIPVNMNQKEFFIYFFNNFRVINLKIMNFQNQLCDSGQIGRSEHVPLGTLDVHLEDIISPIWNISRDMSSQ